MTLDTISAFCLWPSAANGCDFTCSDGEVIPVLFARWQNHLLYCLKYSCEQQGLASGHLVVMSIKPISV